MDGPQHGTPATASPAGAEQPRVVTGAATTATVLIALALVREVLVSVANWRLYFTAHDYLTGRATNADLEAVDTDGLAKLVSWPSFLVMIAAGVAFLVWLWRARINAELMSGAAAHRRSRGWVVGGWIGPVVNLWVPYQVVSDIWRASAPRRPVRLAPVNAWWALFAAAIVVRPIQWRMSSTFDSERDVLANANMSTLLTVLYVGAGVLVVLIVRRITAWQTAWQTQGPVAGGV
ncbi:DUF4328 domain-containing protein [Streptomyces sp. NPDC003077]|uniref:DUF4328 domain-containing protein n=1 Tax=Streptomyces sp. NPDC003077 TaxID=3154443 RepID=UPI0033A6753B